MATLLSIRADPPRTSNDTLGPLAFLGVAVAAVGGPLALGALFVPTALGATGRSAGLVVLLATALFLPPLWIWRRYTDRVVSPGGLYAFVEAAAGRRVAQVQGTVWTVSYLLYVLYTVAYVVYDVLPAVTPAVLPYRPWLEVAIPVVVAAVVLLPLRRSAAVVAAVASVQLGGLGVLTVLGLHHSGVAAGSFTAYGDTAGITRGAGTVSLLYVCAGLPLFLGAEVRGGSAAVRRGLLTAYALVALALLAVALPIAAAGPSVSRADFPGVVLARQVAGGGFAVAVGVGVAVSVLALMTVEMLALSRLLHAMTARPVSTVTRGLAVAVVGASLVSLVDPQRFYDDLLRPSLIALWVSQLLVVAVYPGLHRQGRRLRPRDVALATGASGLMVYGLVTSLTSVLAT